MIRYSNKVVYRRSVIWTPKWLKCLVFSFPSCPQTMYCDSVLILKSGIIILNHECYWQDFTTYQLFYKIFHLPGSLWGMEEASWSLSHLLCFQMLYQAFLNTEIINIRKTNQSDIHFGMIYDADAKALLKMKHIYMKLWKRWNVETRNHDKLTEQHRSNNLWQTKCE